jgi:hypothetical protein
MSVAPATVPNTIEWGPPTWRIFHALAERSGRSSNQRQQIEEARLWASFLASLRRSIPCLLCRQHYSEYLQANPIESILSKFGEERRVDLRTWFYTFHNSVNLRGNKVFEGSIANLESIYGSYNAANFTSDKAILVDNMRRAMFHRFLTRDDMMRTVRFLEELWLTMP